MADLIGNSIKFYVGIEILIIFKGAKIDEIALLNSLTVNLNLLLVKIILLKNLN